VGAALLSVAEFREEVRKVKGMTDKPFGWTSCSPPSGRHRATRRSSSSPTRSASTSKSPSKSVSRDRVRPRQPGADRAPGARARDQGDLARGEREEREEGRGGRRRRRRGPGYDGGGHTGQVGTFTLVPAVVDAVQQPVIAAGGAADGRGLVAALAMGAVGIWMGTRFVASREAYAHVNYKDRITETDDEGTIRTRCFSGKPCRVIKNRTTAEWRPPGRDPAVPAPDGEHQQDRGQERVRGGPAPRRDRPRALRGRPGLRADPPGKGRRRDRDDVVREASDILERLTPAA